jgi:hypothetical protein
MVTTTIAPAVVLQVDALQLVVDDLRTPDGRDGVRAAAEGDEHRRRSVSGPKNARSECASARVRLEQEAGGSFDEAI